MKTIEFTYGPKSLHLYMNSNAMFSIQALNDTAPDGQDDVLDRMMENTADGVALLCKVAHILAAEGELCRRYLQYSPQRVPPELELSSLLSPMQIIGLRSAVIRAINEGYDQPGNDDSGDVDTGLADLEKKRTL